MCSWCNVGGVSRSVTSLPPLPHLTAGVEVSFQGCKVRGTLFPTPPVGALSISPIFKLVNRLPSFLFRGRSYCSFYWQICIGGGRLFGFYILEFCYSILSHLSMNMFFSFLFSSFSFFSFALFVGRCF